MATIGHYEKLRALCGTARLLATGGTRPGAASQVVIFDHVAGKVRTTLDLPTHVLGLALHGDHILCAGADGTLRIFEVEGGRAVHTLRAHEGACAAVVAGGADRIYTAGADGRIRRWDVAGKALAQWSVSNQPLRALAVDSTNEFVAAAGDDGVVHVISPLAPAGTAPRAMPGHEGAIHALAFTPRDGRLVSGGDDGTLRIWYLIGAVECETRAADGPAAAVRALLFPPTPGEAAAASGSERGEPLDRFFAAYADGKVRVFRLEDRRKPRTLECGSRSVQALCYLPPTSSAAKTTLGAVAMGGDSRTLYRCPLELDGNPGEKLVTYEHGFDALTAAVASAKPAREAAYKTLAALDETEALDLLLQKLPTEKEPELRALIASQLGQHHRLAARAALRQALDDSHGVVRLAALQALRTLEGQAALGPLRAALRSQHADLRQVALRAVLELRESSPLAAALLTAALTDSDGGVRLTALDCVLALYPPATPDPLRLAFERGPADVRAEALVRAGFAGLLASPELAPILARALDDDDAEVRRIAFALAVLLHRPLATLLERRDEDFARTTREILRREALRSRPAAAPAATDGKPLAKEPTEAELATVRTRLLAAIAPGPAGQRVDTGAALGDADLQPLLIAMSCRTPGTALRGARGLALLGDTRALGALLQLSREADASLRKDAALALRALQDLRARQRLLWMLDDSDASVRAAALDAYSDLCGGQALVVAEAALQSSHEDIRVRGLDRLIQLGAAGQRTPQVETLLGHALEDEAPKVRTEALRTLWAWHERDPHSVIEQVIGRVLSARFPDLRLRAVEELLRLGQQQDWARSRLAAVIADRDAEVAQAAYDALVKLRGKEDHEAHLLASASIHRGVREAGARGAASTPREPAAVRAALMKLLDDGEPGVRIAALETLDRLLPKDSAPHYAALQGSYLDLRVRAGELLAVRHDERLIDPMRTLLRDKELFTRYPSEVVKPLRLHAAMALASLGSPATLKYFAGELIKDDHPEVREQAARGLATAARSGDEGYLLDLLSHPDIWVRSWGADGLARLGDSRALPVLTGTLRHDHLPIRFSAIVSFAALGPEGYGGMLQGLEDASSEVQDIVFAIVLARDLYAFRRGQPPDLLASALSSQRAEVRFAAARALELRIDPETFLSHVIGVLLPPRPEKAQDMKEWPDEESRGRILIGLADLLASDRPDQRYAAAQVLRLRRQPLAYFREARRISRPIAVGAQLVPDTTPQTFEPAVKAPKKGWLRRLFHGDEARADGSSEDRKEERAAKPDGERVIVSDVEQARLLRLAFGAYVGLLRQVTAGEDERVRRDAIDRIVELGLSETVGRSAALPAVIRALEDPHYLVRKAAFAGLKKLFPAGSAEPLKLAVRSSAADVARAALAEFAARGPGDSDAIAAALSSALPEVRRNAFELLERASPPGSLEPLLLALQSEYADLRIGVIERLATQSDPRVTAALQRAMVSDHDDLRLRAAELLADRKDDRAAEVLGLLLRSEDGAVAERALLALLRLGSERAVAVLAARLDRDDGEAGAQLAARKRVAATLGQTGNPAALAPLAAGLEDEAAELRDAVFDAALELASRAAPPRSALSPVELLDSEEEEVEVVAAAAPAKRKARDDDDDDDEDDDDDDDDDDDKPASPGHAGKNLRPRRDEALLLRFLRTAALSKEPAIRLRAAKELGRLGRTPLEDRLRAPDGEVDALLAGLFADRDVAVRKAAVEGYSRRVRENNAAVEPLLAVLKAGARELLLPAAEGVAAKGQVAALRPLLLLARAGEDPERLRALLALGSLGDARGLPELETVAAGGTKEAPVEPPMQVAAIEGLGRIAGKLTDPEARQRVIEKVEEVSSSDSHIERQQAAVRGLRFIGGERARARLEGLLLDTSTANAVQAEAARQLGLLKDPAAEVALAKALDNWNDDVHLAARDALYRIFATERTRVEFLAVDSRNDDLSEPAGLYLAQAGDPAQLVPRLATLRDDDLRQRLRYGLLRRPHLALAELVKLLAQPDPRAREAAAWLLGARAGQAGALDAAAVVALTAAERRAGELWAQRHTLVDADARAAEAGAWVRLLWATTNATVAQGGAEGRRALLLRSRDLVRAGESGAPAAVREQAVRALAQVGELADGELLGGALADGNGNLRTAAATALAAVAPAQAFARAAAARPFDPVAFAGAAHKPVTAQLATSQGRRLGLPRLIATRTTAPLVELLRGSGAAPDQAARIDAAAALGRAGGSEAVTALRALAFDKKGTPEPLRKAAYRAMKRAQRLADRQKKYEAKK